MLNQLICWLWRHKRGKRDTRALVLTPGRIAFQCATLRRDVEPESKRKGGEPVKALEMRRLQLLYTPEGLRELADELERLGPEWKPTYSSFDGNTVIVEVTKVEIAKVSTQDWPYK